MIEDLEKYLTSKIEEIHESKIGKIEPTHVLYVELKNSIEKDIKDVLNKFYKEKTYIVGKTLNDKYFKNSKWDGEQK